ncbi:MAG: NAD(P)-dependent oxidoreductase [Hyphomicrobiales bacterium]
MIDTSHDAIRKVTFVGLGKMGRPMAMRLIGSGFDVTCHDRVASMQEPLIKAGATGAATLGEAVRGADAVITMLPDDKAVRDAMLGEQGAAQKMGKGSLLIDMSSSAPMGTRTLGEDLLGLGIQMIDAPVSGGVAKAVDGSLAIMAGGELGQVERARPVLERMGGKMFHAGRLGSGHAIKALNNFVSAAGLAAACEAVLVAEAFGIYPDTLVDVLNASTGRNNSTEVKLKPHILSGSFASGFAMALMSKDLRTAADLAKELGAAKGSLPGLSALPVLSGQATIWAEALNELGEQADHTEIFRFLKHAAESMPPKGGHPA